ncbi:MAG TPA: hemolysin family protein [Acidimicrobiales bacterium]
MSAGFLLLALLLLLLNGVFVANEFSVIASRRTRLESLAQEGDTRARFALQSARDLPLQLASSQLGVTMCSLGLGAVAEPSVIRGLENLLSPLGVPDGVARVLGLVIGLGIVVFLHMVFGEVVPRYLALADPEQMLLRLSIFNRAYVIVFRPVIRVIQSLGNAGTRALGVEPRAEIMSAHTVDEIGRMLAESHEEGLIEETAHDLLSGALDFGERPVREVMVPREDITWVSQRASVAEAEERVVATGHSRLLVAGRDLDDIVGFVHAKDLLTVPPEARDRPLPVARIRRVLVLPADRPLDEVLVDIRRTRTHVGVVVDEARRVVGLATLEDVLEDLVGDIRDESDHLPRRRSRS